MPVDLLDISISARSAPKARQKIADWTTVRILPDGYSEQIGPRNRRRRVKLTRCVECERGLPETEFAYHSLDDNCGLSTGICLECWISVARVQKARAKDAERRVILAEILENGHEYDSAQRRAAIFAHASPDWRDRKAISIIYAEARKLSRETGQPHDVDHIYPLQSNLCCGLHVPENLRIVKASVNRSKSNHFPMADSPALEGMSRVEIRNAVNEMISRLTK